MDATDLESVKTFLTKIFQENYYHLEDIDDLIFISLIRGSIRRYSELFKKAESVEQELYEHALSEYVKVWLNFAHEEEERQEASKHFKSYYKDNTRPW